MSTEKPEVSIEPDRPPLVPSTRFTLALLVLFAFIVQYSQRVNLPIAVVCIINRTKTIDHRPLHDVTKQITDDISESTIPTSTIASNIIKKGGIFEEKQFYWTELQQQLLLGGYWGGYIFTQLPGGWLATAFAAKWVFAGSLAISSTASLALTVMYMMPNTHFALMFVIRFITGLAHGVLFPATVALWSVWAVKEERSTLAAIGFGGTHLGTAFTMLLGGLLCRYLNAGWMYLFFGTGVLGFIWLILWIALTANSPQEHKSIGPRERDYIVSKTGATGKKRAMSFSSIPWKKILTSKPVLAVILSHTANLFGLFFFLTNLGKISTELLGFAPQKTGYILTCGFFLTYLGSLFAGLLTDYVVRTKKASLTNARKFFNSVASFTPVLCMVSFAFCDKSRQLLGIITILIFLASSGLPYGSGYVVNFGDVVPAYSGIVFGFANTFASAAGITGNIVAGLVVKQSVLSQWRILFVIFGIVYFFGGLVFLLYGSGKARKWATFEAALNNAKQEKKLDEEEAVPMNEKI